MVVRYSYDTLEDIQSIPEIFRERDNKINLKF